VTPATDTFVHQQQQALTKAGTTDMLQLDYQKHQMYHMALGMITTTKLPPASLS
jgi:hypothetical protein